MTRLRKLLLPALAFLAVPGVLALPGVRWRLVGWARGDPFWRGRPASYYARRVIAALPWQSSGGWQQRPVTAAEDWLRTRRCAVIADAVWGEQFIFYDGPTDDHESAVASALTHHGDERVRFWAACVLAERCPPGVAVPVLTPLLDDPAPSVRYLAAGLLHALKPDSQALRQRFDGRGRDYHSSWGPIADMVISNVETVMELRRIEANTPRKIDPDARRKPPATPDGRGPADATDAAAAPRAARRRQRQRSGPSLRCTPRHTSLWMSRGSSASPCLLPGSCLARAGGANSRPATRAYQTAAVRPARRPSSDGPWQVRQRDPERPSLASGVRDRRRRRSPNHRRAERLQ
jgi:hypothetical protein